MILGNLTSQRQIQDLQSVPGYNDQLVKKDITNVLDPGERDTKKGYPFVQLPLSPNPFNNSFCSLCHSLRFLLASGELVLSNMNFI